MSTRSKAASPPGAAGTVSWDRWSLGTVAVGLVLAIVHAVHVTEMLYYGTVGVVVESVLPFLLAGLLAASGPWLSRRGYLAGERRQVFKWMTVSGLLVGALFLWSLSHQYVVYGGFPHAAYVTTTNLTAGAVLGIVIGLYEVRTHRHYEAVETERERSELQRSRLSVLNRILRHNIRNDASLVQGLCNDIARAADGDVAQWATDAAATVGDLHGLSEKARRIDASLATEAPASAVDLQSLLDDVVGVYERRIEGVSFEVEVADDLKTIHSRGDLLRDVVDELVENAVEHGGEDLTSVVVRADRTDDGLVEVCVLDDGPGIPEIERESLQYGFERDIEHASGIGLWFAKWGAETLGGDISLGGDGSGTVVCVRVPAA